MQRSSWRNVCRTRNEWVCERGKSIDRDLDDRDDDTSIENAANPKALRRRR